jgi:hypothetical protein
MLARCFTFTALIALGSIAAASAQTPAPAAPPATNRGRSSPGTAPAPAAPVRPAPPAPDADAPPAPPPAPPPPPSTPAPRRENQSTNVRVEVTVTDQRPGAAAVTKTVSIVTGDGLNGSVRSQTGYNSSGNAPGGNAPFNVDTWPVILADGKIHTRLIVQYDVVPPPGPGQDGVRLFGTSIRESVALILESGKPMVAVQSTDPVSDRKVSVEVKATVLK